MKFFTCFLVIFAFNFCMRDDNANFQEKRLLFEIQNFYENGTQVGLEFTETGLTYIDMKIMNNTDDSIKIQMLHDDKLHVYNPETVVYHYYDRIKKQYNSSTSRGDNFQNNELIIFPSQTRNVISVTHLPDNVDSFALNYYYKKISKIDECIATLKYQVNDGSFLLIDSATTCD